MDMLPERTSRDEKLLKGVISVYQRLAESGQGEKNPDFSRFNAALFHSGKQLGQGYFKAVGDDLQIHKAWVTLALLDFPDITAVESQDVGHFRLRPAFLVAQIAEPLAESHFDIGRHINIIA